MTGPRFSRMCGNVLGNIDSHKISDDVNYRHQRPALWRLFDFAPQRRRFVLPDSQIPMNGQVVVMGISDESMKMKMICRVWGEGELRFRLTAFF